MRIALKYNKNSYVILSRLNYWPYVRFWHKTCRSWWPLRLKLMLRPFMLTVHIGRDLNPVKTFIDMVQWLESRPASERGLMPFDGIIGNAKVLRRILDSEEARDDDVCG